MRALNFQTIPSNRAKDPYVRPGDHIAIKDHAHGTMIDGKVEQDTFDSKLGKVKQYSIFGYDMHNKPINIDLDSSLNKDYNRTSIPLSVIAAGLHQAAPQFTVSKKASSIKEVRKREKYPDWPFKPIESLTKAANKKKLPYEVIRGEIKDPELAREIGSKSAYYLKANYDFDLQAGKDDKNGVPGSVLVKQGAISGPIVPAVNEKRRSAQIKALTKLANSPDQSFWLDDNSRLIGNWYVPTNSIMVNAQSHIATSETSPSHVGDGLTLNESWLKDVNIHSDTPRGVLLNHAGLNRTSLIDQNKPDKSFKGRFFKSDPGTKHGKMWQATNSTLSHVTALDGKDLQFDQSYLENSLIRQNFEAHDSQLVNTDYNDRPDQFENSIMDHCDTQTNANNALNVNKKIVKGKHISFGQHNPQLNPIVATEIKNEVVKPAGKKQLHIDDLKANVQDKLATQEKLAQKYNFNKPSEKQKDDSIDLDF